MASEVTIDWDKTSVDDLCATEGQYTVAYRAKAAVALDYLLNEYILTYHGEEIHVNWDKLVELGIVTYGHD